MAISSSSVTIFSQHSFVRQHVEVFVSLRDQLRRYLPQNVAFLRRKVVKITVFSKNNRCGWPGLSKSLDKWLYTLRKNSSIHVPQAVQNIPLTCRQMKQGGVNNTFGVNYLLLPNEMLTVSGGRAPRGYRNKVELNVRLVILLPDRQGTLNFVQEDSHVVQLFFLELLRYELQLLVAGKDCMQKTVHGCFRELDDIVKPRADRPFEVVLSLMNGFSEQVDMLLLRLALLPWRQHLIRKGIKLVEHLRELILGVIPQLQLFGIHCFVLCSSHLTLSFQRLGHNPRGDKQSVPLGIVHLLVELSRFAAEVSVLV